MGLAGRKVKQRIPKDPRNLTWADDAAKFGASYLAKFGWDASKGLGVDGEGRTSHLKVSQKLDMMGIGAAHQKDPNGMAWKQNKDFENLLKRLNAQQDGSGGEDAEKEILGGGWVKAGEGRSEGNEVAQGDEEDEEKMTTKRKKEKKRKAEESLDDEGKKRRKKKQKKHSEKEEQPKEESNRKQKKSKSTSSDEVESSKQKLIRKKTREENSDGSSSSSSEREELTPKPSVTQAPTSAPPRHRAHRARVIAAKRLASQSASAMSEILGIAATPSSITPLVSASQTPQGTLTPITDDVTIEILTTSTKSVADYFKEKLLAKAKLKSGTRPPAGHIVTITTSSSSAGQEGDAGPSVLRAEPENGRYDDTPRIGLGGSRLRLAGLSQTSDVNAPSRGNHYAQDFGMSKFSSLMSSNFLNAISTSPTRGTDQDSEDRKNEGDTPDENASKRVKAGKDKRTKKDRTKDLEAKEAELPGSTDDHENKRKKQKKAKLSAPNEGLGASDDVQTARISPDAKEVRKETKREKKKRERDGSTEQQSLTSHTESTRAEKTREDRKREKVTKKAERKNQINEV